MSFIVVIYVIIIFLYPWYVKNVLPMQYHLKCNNVQYHLHVTNKYCTMVHWYIYEKYTISYNKLLSKIIYTLLKKLLLLYII